jgi:hypothetical protein
LKAIPAGLAILFDVCTVLQYIYGYPRDVQVNQAAKGGKSGWDALADFLEFIT